MHTFTENSSGVPAFLAKLWRLVEDEETNNLIYWNADGKSFIIQNQAQFARDILPLNYKHNNMASFIRQLNMYGFHKITSLDGGGLKFDRDEMEFSHPYFQREQPFLLEHIKRKISTTKTTTADDKTNVKHEVVSKVLSDVKLMKGRQDSLDNRFISMKQENEALWREVAILRQKHMKQQQIVNKLIQFLVTIVQPQRSSGIGSMGGMGGVKRRYQLMINDIPNTSKVRKTSRSGEGPVIRELTEELLDNYADGDIEAASPYVVSPETFQAASINDYEEVESIDDVDPDQIISEDVETAISDSTTGIEDDQASSVYNTADYNSDLLYDTNTNITTAGAVPNNVAATAKVAGIIPSIPVEQLLKNVSATITTTTPNPNAAFFKGKQPIQQYPKQVINPKLIPKKPVAGAAGNMQGTKRLPIIKIASNQLLNSQPSTSDIRNTSANASASGHSLIDTSKLKAVKQQQQQQIQQQIRHQKPVVQTITQPGNKPILITVGKAPMQTVGQQIVAPGKSYKNKNDFISSEIPIELFQDEGSHHFEQDDADQLNGAGAATLPVNVNELSNEIVQPNPVVASPSTSGVDMSTEPTKEFTIAKYNRTTSNDDIMRLTSPDQLNNHLECVQGDIEALKELLRGSEDYQMDANTLLSHPQETVRKNSPVLSGIDAESLSSILNKLFGDNDIFQQYGIPMNPTDTTIPELVERDRAQNDAASTTGSELISYQTPIDFTDFLNLDDSQLNMAPTTATDAAAAMSQTLNFSPQNSATPEMEYASAGDLSTPYVKQEQFSFPK